MLMMSQYPQILERFRRTNTDGQICAHAHRAGRGVDEVLHSVTFYQHR